MDSSSDFGLPLYNSLYSYSNYVISLMKMGGKQSPHGPQQNSAGRNYVHYRGYDDAVSKAYDHGPMGLPY